MGWLTGWILDVQAPHLWQQPPGQPIAVTLCAVTSLLVPELCFFWFWLVPGLWISLWVCFLGPDPSLTLLLDCSKDLLYGLSFGFGNSASDP